MKKKKIKSRKTKTEKKQLTGRGTGATRGTKEEKRSKKGLGACNGRVLTGVAREWPKEKGQVRTPWPGYAWAGAICGTAVSSPAVQGTCYTSL